MRILPLESVIEKTSLPGSIILERAKLGSFPDPVVFSSGHSGWIESEVDEWIKDQIRFRDMENGEPSAWGGPVGTVEK